MSETHRPGWDKPLDPSFYAPDEEEKAFLKVAIGIQDSEDLKTHIIAVQAKAFELYKYPCIRMFGFINLRIARVPAYPQFLELGKQRKGAIMLDIGCCFGCDTRKAVLDGWPVDGVIAGDLSKDFWDLGHQLFRSTPSTFPVHHLQGDVLDPAYLAQAPVLPTSSTPPAAAPRLGTVTSLNELHGQVSAVFASAFFHLFKFDDQERVARRLAGLLSPLPGSMLFGMHNGQPEKRVWAPHPGTQMHCHSVESWKELWEDIFAEVGVEVEVDAQLEKREDGGMSVYGTYPDNTEQRYYMWWSVTRV